jgi:polyferredoxin
LALWGRTSLTVTVQPDRNPLFVRLTDGSIRNSYTVKILNKLQRPRRFRIGVEGLAGAVANIASEQQQASDLIEVPASELREARLLVTLSPDTAAKLPAEANNFEILVTDTGNAVVTHHATSFRRPNP